MPKNRESRAKSTTRKPLREVVNGVKPSSRYTNTSVVQKKESKIAKNPPQNDEQDGDDCLDRLLLIHSDLSSLIHEVDELVGQALKLKLTRTNERKEIESFVHVLSEMHISLKPWVPRFQKAVSSPSLGSENQPEQSTRTVDVANEDIGKVVDSPDQSNWDSLVSPSPLVSWRAGCSNEGGRQLFLLTPLPMSKAVPSKLQGSSKPAFEEVRTNTNVGPPPSLFLVPGDKKADLLEATPVKLSDCNATCVETTMKCGFISPEKFSKMEPSSVVAMTPCLKVSPPKSCVLLEPISEFTHKKNCVVRASTPFPIGIHSFSGFEDSDSSSNETSEHLILKYPELVGIKPTQELGNGRKVVEASPNWFMSPPKSCILMELPDDKPITISATNLQLPRTARGPYWKTNKETEFQGGQTVTKNSCSQGLGDNLAVLERTPMGKEPESTIRRGKCPGENTLKKELWTKFEAATTAHGLRFNVSVLREEETDNNKGFLDLLDEVSRDDKKSAVVP